MSQWAFASRNVYQPQPWFSRRVFPAAAAAAFIGHTFFAAPAQAVEQPQPAFFGGEKIAQRAATPLSGRSFELQPQADPTQIQPVFFHPQPGNLAPRMLPTWTAGPQADPTHLQPQIWRVQLDLVAISSGQGTYSPQQDPFQPQPWYAKPFFSTAVAATQPTGEFFAGPQADTSQLQPQFWKAAPGNLSPRMLPTWTAGPQADPTQIQPKFWQAQPGNLAPARGQFFVPGQLDLSQPQPQVWKQQLTSAATAAQPFGQWFVPPQQAQDQTQPAFWRGQFVNIAPATVQWFATRQDDPTQIAPQVWRAQFQNVAPAPRQWFVPGQADPTQLQPAFRGQVPVSQATQTPPTGQWFARPQDDPTQIQPSVFTPTAALIPSVTPPVVVVSGGQDGAHWPPKRRRRLVADDEPIERAAPAIEVEPVAKVEPAQDAPIAIPVISRAIAEALEQLRPVARAKLPRIPKLDADPEKVLADAIALQAEVLRVEMVRRSMVERNNRAAMAAAALLLLDE